MVQDEEGWHVSTEQYEYYIYDDAGNELIAWHWHPGSAVTYPHLHVPAGDIVTRDLHLPTGRVSIESVIRLLINDLGVPPSPGHATDYEQILNQSERDFIQHRRWHSAVPETRHEPA